MTPRASFMNLAELRPDLLNREPLIAYRDSMRQWDVLHVSSKGAFTGFAPIGAASVKRKRSPECWPGMAKRTQVGTGAAAGPDRQPGVLCPRVHPWPDGGAAA